MAEKPEQTASCNNRSLALRKNLRVNPNRNKRNPHRSDTREKVPKDLPKGRKVKAENNQGKRFKGEIRISRMI
jgi:hypothetical protein